MIAGRMNTWLTIFKPVYSVNEYGEEEISYESTGEVHAERVNLSGRRIEEVSEHFPAYSAVFNIRDAHEIDANWRAEERDGHLYTVTAVEPNKRRGYNQLICERVNE